MGLLLKIGQVVWRICEFLCGKVFCLDSPYDREDRKVLKIGAKKANDRQK